ncbi:hypothetical protein ES703_116626 [subsurface metagenome]
MEDLFCQLINCPYHLILAEGCLLRQLGFLGNGVDQFYSNHKLLSEPTHFSPKYERNIQILAQFQGLSAINQPFRNLELFNPSPFHLNIINHFKLMRVHEPDPQLACKCGGLDSQLLWALNIKKNKPYLLPGLQRQYGYQQNSQSCQECRPTSHSGYPLENQARQQPEVPS